MTKVEQVARAICREMNINPDGHTSAHRFNAVQDRVEGTALVTLSNWQAAEHLARAAIAAMREPTEAMARAGDAAGCFWWGCDLCSSPQECPDWNPEKPATEHDTNIWHTWRAMIDAAGAETAA